MSEREQYNPGVDKTWASFAKTGEQDVSSPEVHFSQPDQIEAYEVPGGYQEGRLFTEKGKVVDVRNIAQRKPGEVALMQEELPSGDQELYILARGYLINVARGLRSDVGATPVVQISPETTGITVGQSFAGGEISRVLVTSDAIHSGDSISSDKQPNPVSYFAKKLMDHRRKVGAEELDPKKPGHDALIELEKYI